MNWNREAKHILAIFALVAALAFGLNSAVVPDTDESFLVWGLGFLLAAVLLWLWVQRDVRAEKQAAAADDLTQIEGIGVVFQAILQAAEITTFARLAGTAPAELETLIKDADKIPPRSLQTWTRQATYAAEGDWEGLRTFQDTIK